MRVLLPLYAGAMLGLSIGGYAAAAMLLGGILAVAMALTNAGVWR